MLLAKDRLWRMIGIIEVVGVAKLAVVHHPVGAAFGPPLAFWDIWRFAAPSTRNMPPPLDGAWRSR
jgi:hypothetical protein